MAEKPLLVAPTSSFSRFFPSSVSAKLTFPAEQRHNTLSHQNLFTLLPNYHQAPTYSARTEFDNKNKQLNPDGMNNQKEESYDETRCKYTDREWALMSRRLCNALSAANVDG